MGGWGCSRGLVAPVGVGFPLRVPDLSLGLGGWSGGGPRLPAFCLGATSGYALNRVGPGLVPGLAPWQKQGLSEVCIYGLGSLCSRRDLCPRGEGATSGYALIRVGQGLVPCHAPSQSLPWIVVWSSWRPDHVRGYVSVSRLCVFLVCALLGFRFLSWFLRFGLFWLCPRLGPGRCGWVGGGAGAGAGAGGTA